MPEIPAPAATALRGMAAAGLRHAVTAVGMALATRGYIDAGTADRATAPIVEGMLGIAMACGSAGWSMFRAWFTHSRFAALWARLTGDTSPAGAVAPGDEGEAEMNKTLKQLLHAYGPTVIALVAQWATDQIEKSKAKAAAAETPLVPSPLVP